MICWRASLTHRAAFDNGSSRVGSDLRGVVILCKLGDFLNSVFSFQYFSAIGCLCSNGSATCVCVVQMHLFGQNMCASGVPCGAWFRAIHHGRPPTIPKRRWAMINYGGS